ncbi:MAG: glutathione synthase, partial [Longimicrobiales bacterium]
MRLGVIMDPIGGISIKKDSTFAMLLAAQRRRWAIQYMEPVDLFIDGVEPRARMRALSVKEDPDNWFSFHGESTGPLSELDVILMRKDPPVDMEYM